MLVALQKEAGERIAAWDASKGLEYICPECKHEVILKQGTIVIEHYAHHPNAACLYGTGESQRHTFMKKLSGIRLTEFAARVDYEVVVVSDRRADVVLYGCVDDEGREWKQVVVECQASSTSVDEVKARMQDYRSMCIPLLWVWSSDRLGLPEKLWHTYSGGERRIPVEVRYVAACNDGWVTVMDHQGLIYECSLRRAATRSNDYGSYTPKTMRGIGAYRSQGVLPISPVYDEGVLCLRKLPRQPVLLGLEKDELS